MRRILTVASGVLAVAAILALGIAVAGLASSGPNGVAATTNETNETPKTLKLAAALTSGQEVPKPTGTKAGAGGTFNVTYNESSGSYSISWKLAFKNLTGPATAAHIHKGKPGKAGAALVALCGPCRSGAKGKKKITHPVATALEKGLTYVNVHTTSNPGGEIRGQIKKR